MQTSNKIAEAFFEIICGLGGYRDDKHSKWEKEAKQYLKRLTQNKNISYEKNTIEIQNADGTKTYYKLTITK